MKTIRLALPVLAVLALAAAGCSHEPPPRPPPPPPPAAPPPAAPAPTVTVALTGAEIDVKGDIEFDTGSANLRDSAMTRDTLTVMAGILNTNPLFTRVRIEGHTDSDGTVAGNQTLSEGRAASVVTWLVAHGVAAGRLHSVGCASRDPLAPNDTPEHKQRNRRTEFDIETIDGKQPPGYTLPCAPNTFKKHL
jgi:outer membrane protein OmpA-like peptidoglycan-associated protein